MRCYSIQAISQAKQKAAERQAAGFNQAELDKVAKAGFAAGTFEDSEEDGLGVVDEFYPETSDMPSESEKQQTQLSGSLKEKLATRINPIRETESV